MKYDGCWLDYGFRSYALKKSDRSFDRMGRTKYRAVNKNGYMVDLIKAMPKDIRIYDKKRMGVSGDVEAAEIRNLHWLISSPKFSQVVIGEDGLPAMMTGPDPRAFALHKIWLSHQKDRDPLKKSVIWGKVWRLAIC